MVGRRVGGSSFVLSGFKKSPVRINKLVCFFPLFCVGTGKPVSMSFPFFNVEVVVTVYQKGEHVLICQDVPEVLTSP